MYEIMNLPQGWNWTTIENELLSLESGGRPKGGAKGILQGIPSIGVGKFCYIENAILDKNCHIGNNVRIIGSKHLQDGEFDTYCIKDGVIVIKKDAIIKDGTIIP